MSTENNSTAGAPPAATQTIVQPPAAAPPTTPVAPPAGNEPPEKDPNWLTPRLAREREKGVKDALKAMGFATTEEAKAAADSAKAAAEAKKSAEQKALEATQSAATEKARADAALEVATEHAARMMVGLTPEQKAAVDALAGDDPVKQLKTIGALAPTWAQADGASTQPAPTGAAKPSTTAPPAGAPNGAAPPAPNSRATYESMRSQNPFAAASFGSSNPDVYAPKT